MKRYDEKYEEILENINADKQGLPEVKAHQAYSKQKAKEKIVGAVSIILIGTGLIAVLKGCPKTDSNTKSSYEYVLYDPTDMDNDEERFEYIEEVNDNNKNDEAIKAELTDKMVKYYNGTLTKEDFEGMSDEEILKEFQSYNLNAYEVFSGSVRNLVNIKSDRTYTYEQNEKLIAGLFDSNSESENSIFGNGMFGKKYFEEYVSIINEQAKDIVNNTNGDYTGNANTWYNLCMKVFDDKEVPVNEKYAFAKLMSAHIHLFYTELTKEQQEYLEKTDFEGTYGNLVQNVYVEAFGIKNIKTNEDCGDKTKLGEKYNKSDEKDAQKYAGLTGEEGKTTTKKGGKKQGATSEVVSKSTVVSSSKSTTVINKGKETTKKQEQKGGKTVDEKVVDKPPVIISDEDVKPGKDNASDDTLTEEEYKEKTKSNTTQKSTTETTTETQNNNSNDREFEEVLTEDEWLRYLGMGSIGLGSVVGGAKKIKKRK